MPMNWITASLSETRLTFFQRLTLLVSYYVSGPVFGLHTRFMFLDRYPHRAEYIATICVSLLTLASLTVHFDLISLALVCVALPIAVYAFTPIAHLVLEYRAYLSILGVSLFAAVVMQQYGSLYPISLLPLFIGYCVLTSGRAHILSSGRLFWKQVAIDAPSVSMLDSYRHEAMISGLIDDVDQLVHNMLKISIPFESDSWMMSLKQKPTELPDIGRMEGVRLMLKSLSRRHPYDGRISRNLGMVYYRMGYYTDAKVYFADAVRFNPSDLLAWLGLAQYHIDHREYRVASVYLQRAIELEPHSMSLQQHYSNLNEGDNLMRRFGLDETDPSIIFVTDDMLPEWIRNRQPEPERLHYGDVEEMYRRAIESGEPEPDKLN